MECSSILEHQCSENDLSSEKKKRLLKFGGLRKRDEEESSQT